MKTVLFLIFCFAFAAQGAATEPRLDQTEAEVRATIATPPSVQKDGWWEYDGIDGYESIVVSFENGRSSSVAFHYKTPQDPSKLLPAKTPLERITPASSSDVAPIGFYLGNPATGVVWQFSDDKKVVARFANKRWQPKHPLKSLKEQLKTP